MDKNKAFGNTSQSIVAVPNIFLLRDIKTVETFQTVKRDRYFKEKSLLAQAQQLNINNNPIKNNRKLEDYNKTKYIPINQIISSQVKPANNLNIHYNRNYSMPKKETLISNMTTTEAEDIKFNNNSSMLVIDEESKNNRNEERKPLGMNLTSTNKYLNEYNKFEKEFEKHHVSNYTNPKLVTDIKNNLNKLIDRINANYDTQKWSNADSKTLFNKTNDITYTPLTYYNMYNESESSKFRTTLQNKIKSLSTVNENTEKILGMFNKSTLHKDLDGKVSSIDLTKVHPSSYPYIDEQHIEDMTKKNSYLYPKFQPSILYSEYPSPTYSEFTKRKGEFFLKNRKRYIKELTKKNIVDTSKYNCNKYDAGNNYILNDY